MILWGDQGKRLEGEDKKLVYYSDKPLVKPQRVQSSMMACGCDLSLLLGKRAAISSRLNRAGYGQYSGLESGHAVTVDFSDAKRGLF